VSANEWPPIYEVGTRVEVDLATFDVPHMVRGTIRHVDPDPEDPTYFVELDHSTNHSIKGELTANQAEKLNRDLGTNETYYQRWITWDFVRALSALEVLAENV
jgi:hypothetical protein